MTNILFRMLCILLFIYLSVYWFILRRLQVKHTEKWKELGSPTLFLNNSITNGLKAFRFQWSSEFKKLNDGVLNKLILWVKLIFSIYVIAFVALIAALA